MIEVFEVFTVVSIDYALASPPLFFSEMGFAYCVAQLFGSF
jgi:hypothetical protein